MTTGRLLPLRTKRQSCVVTWNDAYHREDRFGVPVLRSLRRSVIFFAEKAAQPSPNAVKAPPPSRPSPSLLVFPHLSLIVISGR